MNDTKHLGEDELILHYYGEADDPAASEGHLKACAACRAAFESLQSTLNAVEAPAIPWRAETYGSDVWARLEPHVGRPNHQIFKSPNHQISWRSLAWTPARLALAGACVALPLVGFLVGLRWSSAPGRPVTRTGVVAETVPPERVRERILLITVGDHLERSQMALVELVNAEADRPIDISSEQTWVEDLLAANRLYRQSASEEGETAVADLLDELERVLVEIARSPSTLSAVELARLRARIEERGILFKVKVLGTRIREDAQRSFTQPTS
ncbi:MAG: hypothetical protein HYS05_21525 [Acidobacteria bacterium]|nr:hypothetical protein [Acidobacteriota bacterium]